MANRNGRVIALLGAECTGKTTLALDVGDALRQAGHRVAVVPEFLREFTQQHGRTPGRDEQASIAHEQHRRIEHAAADHELVLADTTALTIAVYSDFVFGDPTLYAEALRRQSSFDLTLLMAVDLPWQADGLQRDGAHVRDPVDRRLRQALAQAGLAYAVICGSGAARRGHALTCIRQSLGLAAPRTTAAPRWRGVCERCGDPQCERRLLARC
jgi:nicotinamide riboside kinase